MIPAVPRDSHYMQLPREVLIGNNVAPLVGETLTRLGFHGPVLMVTGEKVLSVAGDTVLESLKLRSFKTETMTVKSSTTEEVSKVENKIREMKPDVVVGVGGGKDIDVAKLSSMKADTRFLSVPTAASHDGIASPLVSMKGMDRPYSYVAHSPNRDRSRHRYHRQVTVPTNREWLWGRGRKIHRSARLEASPPN